MRWKKRYTHLIAVTILALLISMLALHWLKPKLFIAAAAIVLLSILSSWFSQQLGGPLIRLAEGVLALGIRVILALFYLFILMPWSVVYRLGQAARDRLNKKQHSHYVQRRHQYQAADFKRSS